MNRTHIDVHVLQTVPPSNLNRDDTGSPKTAYYGGVRRARVSSQAWKRATRRAFDGVLDRGDLGVRTKRVVELVAEEISRQDATVDAAAAAERVLTAAGIKVTAPRTRKGQAEPPKESGYLVFLSRGQVRALATAALREGGLPPGKELKALVNSDHSIDLSLFGRMVAEDPGYNVDAAVQVAHAISVHAVEPEFDYFTAVDDHKAAGTDEDAGAGMIGTVEFNSATLYRYATLDLGGLADNLGDPAATRSAVEAFVGCFVSSMPTGKQNTFANRTLPDAVWVRVREGQPVNLVGAFEEAVVSDRGRAGLAVERLAAHAASVDAAYGLGSVAEFVSGPRAELLGPTQPWPQAVAGLGALVADRLGAVAASA